MNTNERKKLNGSKRPLYIWNEPDYKTSDRNHRRVYRQDRPAKNEASRPVLMLVLCAFGVLVVLAAIIGFNNAQLDNAISKQQAANENISDSIDAYQTAISDATSVSNISQLAEEKLGMVNSEEQSGFSVYIPNRSGSTLTANAGGN